MEILHDLGKTNHVRLDEEEYLIIHTPKGTIDIDVAKAHVDMNMRASSNYDITRWNPDDRTARLIKPLGHPEGSVGAQPATTGQQKRCPKCGRMVSNRFENFEKHFRSCGLR